MNGESGDDDCFVWPDWTDEFTTTTTDTQFGIHFRDGEAVFPWHHVYGLRRTMLRTGAARGPLGFDHTTILKKLSYSGADQATFFDGDRLNGTGRADFRAVRAVVGAKRGIEVLIRLKKSSETVFPDRWSEDLVRTMGDTQLACGAVALEVGEGLRAGWQNRFFVVLGESVRSVATAFFVTFISFIVTALRHHQSGKRQGRGKK